MRIAKLDLLAYGPFRDLSLDLSAPGLHVVFGRNEAGKSTTLRAITGFLYGIERHTRDAHVHKATDLRIGGTIVGDDGEVVRVVRRKGNTNTLLDDRGQPIDDAIVLRHLRGVTEETFRHAFGLDHETLREGAKALLDGKGDLGESLFDASVGGGGEVQRLLGELDAEADRLWSPRGKTLPLNDALKTFADAKNAIREKETLPSAHVTQQQQLDETKTVLAERMREKHDVVRRRALIDAARKRAPLERRRAVLLAERAPLATTDEEAMAIDAVVRRIPEHERALEEQRSLAADRIRIDAVVAEAERRAGVVASATKDAMRLDAPREARLLKLATEREKVIERIAKTREDVEREERTLAKHASLSPAETPDASVTDVARALDAARALGDLEARIANDRAKVERRRRDLEAKAAALGGHTHALDALCEIELPSLGDVDALAKRADAADRAVTRAESDHEKVLRELDEIDAQIAESEGGFAPPDAQELRSARAARDEKWTAVRAAKTPIERVAAEGAFDAALRDVDALVDRMLAEADRITALGRLKARREQRATLLAKTDAELATLRAARASVDEELHARFAASKVRATTVAAMRTWLLGRAAIVEARSELAEQEADIAASTRRLDDARDALAKALGPDAKSEALADLLAAATTRVSAHEDARRARNEAAKIRAKIEEDLERHRVALARDEATLADIQEKLAGLVGPLGVAADASAEEIRSAVDSLRDLFASIDERARIAAAAAANDAAIAAFTADVHTVAGESSGVALDTARALGVRRDRVVHIARELAEIDRLLGDLGAEDLPEDIALLAADADAATRALDDLDANIDVLDREIRSLSEKIGGIEAGLALMKGDSRAADAAAQAQEALARVRANAEKWVRAKLASVILKREIERYREENQGPLLGRASSLFARLTLGAFTGLRAGFDDKDRASLRLVRAGGAEVDVEALSEGTRDQLYLSLRLASLLRYAEIAAPMPLVLDDVLVHFDDERSAAALSVLAEVAKTVQVLFFTHHARLVDLARSAIPAGELVVHELASRPLEIALQRQWM